MGRKCKYDTHVKPHLADIKEWITECTEKQIAQKLGVGLTAFAKYKNENEELRQALTDGKVQLVKDLKESLKKKAKGYHYEETKTIIRENPDGTTSKVIEKYEKYAQPDTGAIHLLLKNLDDSWRNDDAETMQIKRDTLEVARKKAEENRWE